MKHLTVTDFDAAHVHAPHAPHAFPEDDPALSQLPLPFTAPRAPKIPHDLLGPKRLPARCPFCGSRRIATRGLRTRSGHAVPQLTCRHCGRRFTHRARPFVHRHYPDNHILEALTLHSKGHTFEATAQILNRKHGHRLNKGTIHRWVHRHAHLLGYLRFRDGGRLYHPDNIARAHRLNHRQTYHCLCHAKKLELALAGELDPVLPAGLPMQNLSAFLTGIATLVRDAPFNDPRAIRASQLSAAFIDQDVPVTVTTNTAVAIAALVLPAVGDNTQRHPRLQEFMIFNDASTIAVEVPLWLDHTDIAALEHRHAITLPHTAPGPRLPPPPARTTRGLTTHAQHAPITGHADFIQLRHGRVHILDYKPNAKRCKPFAQLTAYALALTRRVPGLTLTDITCAWFDESAYYEFSPQAALRREP